MKRERKYRVWDGKQMIYFDLGDIDNGGMIGLPTWDNPIALLDREVMDFVGLKDSKGVDIYEGDVVQFGETLRLVEDIRRFPQVAGPEDMSRSLESLAGYCEVIGNIWENPDLLNNKS